MCRLIIHFQNQVNFSMQRHGAINQREIVGKPDLVGHVLYLCIYREKETVETKSQNASFRT